MAKDVSSKPVSSNNTGNNSPPISDHQKVPPLRIVLNTSGNQKSSSTAIAVTADQQQDLKRDKAPQDVKVDNGVKTGGRVRIKLGTNKQVSKSNTLNEDGQKSNNYKEEISANYGHLRRITRRSQRTIHTNNEDEESISSMTSTDENQNNTNNNSDSNNCAQDTTNPAVPAQSNTLSATTATTNNSSSSSETPRRYKRRKGETSECQLSEHDLPFNFQNYKLPVQNSFELYKNIRKQVDKKLKNLSTIHPKTPYGFRDYMLTRGAYLLEGNKLGNGTNLFMNEDGGLHQAPLGKYHALRCNRINYSVPNRAKVPLGLPVNSPLYNLFIDQEKERYRMRMQHIKEREKLTLSAEQEMIRVYNQAAMAAANQVEPFSVCTMLKHQEIYNYLDLDGFTILASEDAQQDETKQDGVRTRRRQREQISSSPGRKNSNSEQGDTTQQTGTSAKDSKSPESQSSLDKPQREDSKISGAPSKDELERDKPAETSMSLEDEAISKEKEKTVEESVSSKPSYSIEKIEKEKAEENKDSEATNSAKGLEEADESESGDKSARKPQKDNNLSEDASEARTSHVTRDEVNEATDSKELVAKVQSKSEAEEMKEIKDTSEHIGEKVAGENVTEDFQAKIVVESDCRSQDELKTQKQEPMDISSNTVVTDDKNVQIVSMEEDSKCDNANSTQSNDEQVLSDDDRRAYNKGIFLSQLQDIDDKWDKIRGEMLIRHRNEAESLYAVQRLEWEWKTKEIGACDVRMTPIIDNTLVPKLDIYSQDY